MILQSIFIRNRITSRPCFILIGNSTIPIHCANSGCKHSLYTLQSVCRNDVFSTGYIKSIIMIMLVDSSFDGIPARHICFTGIAICLFFAMFQSIRCILHIDRRDFQFRFLFIHRDHNQLFARFHKQFRCSEPFGHFLHVFIAERGEVFLTQSYDKESSSDYIIDMTFIITKRTVQWFAVQLRLIAADDGTR